MSKGFSFKLAQMPFSKTTLSGFLIFAVCDSLVFPAIHFRFGFFVQLIHRSLYRLPMLH